MQRLQSVVALQTFAPARQVITQRICHNSWEMLLCRAGGVGVEPPPQLLGMPAVPQPPAAHGRLQPNRRSYLCRFCLTSAAHLAMTASLRVGEASCEGASKRAGKMELSRRCYTPKAHSSPRTTATTIAMLSTSRPPPPPPLQAPPPQLRTPPPHHHTMHARQNCAPGRCGVPPRVAAPNGLRRRAGQHRQVDQVDAAPIVQVLLQWWCRRAGARGAPHVG